MVAKFRAQVVEDIVPIVCSLKAMQAERIGLSPQEMQIFDDNYKYKDGNPKPGYYLWADHAKSFVYSDGAQYNYGYETGYFDSIVNKIEKVDENAFSDLVANVRRAEALAKKALAELEAGNYTYEVKYIEMFGTEDRVYKLNKGDELKADMDSAYYEFSNWLGSWEL
jgi:hypothetical protein